MVVPGERLEAVAAQVSAFEGINHNYEREAPGPRDPNLWFVAAAPDAAALAGMLLAIEAATGLAVLRLPLQRPYRIDLGFDMGHDLRAVTAGPFTRSARPAQPAHTPGARSGLRGPRDRATGGPTDAPSVVVQG